LGVTSIEFSIIIESILKNALIMEVNVTQQHLYAATCHHGTVTLGFVTAVWLGFSSSIVLNLVT
jgi:hypothetical protein